MAMRVSGIDQSGPGISTEVIPVHAEELFVDRQQHLSGMVRVSVQTATREQQIDEMLSQDRVEIERVSIGRIIDSIPETRVEGDTTIIPVVEEIVVVERRLILKEEIHLHRVRTSTPHREIVTLREQTVTIERGGPDTTDQATTGNIAGVDHVPTSTERTP